MVVSRKSVAKEMFTIWFSTKWSFRRGWAKQTKFCMKSLPFSVVPVDHLVEVVEVLPIFHTEWKEHLLSSEGSISRAVWSWISQKITCGALSEKVPYSPMVLWWLWDFAVGWEWKGILQETLKIETSFLFPIALLFPCAIPAGSRDGWIDSRDEWSSPCIIWAILNS